MFEPKVFRKEIYCIEESTSDIVGAFRRPHNDPAPGELCSPSLRPCAHPWLQACCNERFSNCQDIESWEDCKLTSDLKRVNRVGIIWLNRVCQEPWFSCRAPKDWSTEAGVWRPEDGATCKLMVTARWCPWVTSHCDSHHKRIIVILSGAQPGFF